MQPVSYSRRRAAISRGEREWRVEESSLFTRGASGNERRTPWRDVASVRLKPAPLKDRPWRYVFEIQTKHGPKIVIENSHYLSRGAFEDRSARYSPFVRAALARIAAENPKARALMGETQKRYFFLLLLALVSFGALAFALIAIPTPLDALPFASLGKLLIVLLLLPVFALWVLGSLPRGVRLDELPARAFPPDPPLN